MIDTNHHADTPHVAEHHIDGAHDPVGDMTGDIAQATSDAIAPAAVSPKVKKPKASSKAMLAMKKGVNDMTDSVTRPVKNVMNNVRARTMGLVDRLKAGEHLSTKEIFAILAIVPGATIIIGAHYANIFSKKAQEAIEAGKNKWEKFLHSLGLSEGAGVQDIAQAEAVQGNDVVQTTPTLEAANDAHGHGNVEHPGQDKIAA